MGRQPHVCFVTLSFGENSAGGVMHHMVALGRALHARGVRVTVLCPSYGPPWRYLHDARFTVIGIQEAPFDQALAPAMPGFGWRCRRALIDLHREHPLDIVHLHDRPPILGALPAARQIGVPVIYTAHSCFSRAQPPGPGVPVTLARLFEQAIARAAVPIIAVSRWVAEGMIAAGAAPEQVTVIGNGVDAHAFPCGAQQDRDPGEILFVGRLDADKGLDVLLRALALLPSRNGPYLTVVGEGEHEGEYRRQARDLGIGERVRFVGRQMGSGLAVAYRHAAVFVLPSRVEPFGMVVLEAMASGAPVVTTSVGGIAEIVEAERTAIVVPPDDAEALARAIGRLLSDPGLAATLAGTARSVAERRFSWEAVAEQTLIVYRRAGAQVPLPVRPEMAAG